MTEILMSYGLPPGPHPTVEIDHLIPICLGSADTDDNLWPQPRRSIEPIWNAERKDVLERRVCEMACGGQIDVVTAQMKIASDWAALYRELIGEPGH